MAPLPSCAPSTATSGRTWPTPSRACSCARARARRAKTSASRARLGAALAGPPPHGPSLHLPMKPSLRQQLERLALRLSELDATLADPAIAADMKRYREVSREHAEAAGLVELFRPFDSREHDLAAANELLAESSADAAM